MAVDYSTSGMSEMPEMKNQVSPKSDSPGFMPDFSSVQYPDYAPEEDYTFVPVSETDPWFTSDYIEVLHTEGGELFTKRSDGTQPIDVSETYVGPYYRWVREPQYDDSRKQLYGVVGEPVIGESYYGKNGFGKPKNQGLRPNAILEPMSSILRSNLGGPMMEDWGAPDAQPYGIEPTPAERQMATTKGIDLDAVAHNSQTLSGALVIKQGDSKNMIHITDNVTLQDAKSVLSEPNTDIGELAPAVKRFGLKGRAPIITNQPNTKVDFGNQ